jgi:hypothetical protein
MLILEGSYVGFISAFSFVASSAYMSLSRYYLFIKGQRHEILYTYGPKEETLDCFTIFSTKNLFYSTVVEI